MVVERVLFVTVILVRTRAKRSGRVFVSGGAVVVKKLKEGRLKP